MPKVTKILGAVSDSAPKISSKIKKLNENIKKGLVAEQLYKDELSISKANLQKARKFYLDNKDVRPIDYAFAKYEKQKALHRYLDGKDSCVPRSELKILKANYILKKEQLNLEKMRLQNKNISKAQEKAEKAYDKFKKICDKYQYVTKSRILADRRNEKFRKMVRNVESLLLKPFGLNISKRLEKSWENVESLRSKYGSMQKKYNIAKKQYANAKKDLIKTEQNLLNVQKRVDNAKLVLSQLKSSTPNSKKP